MFILFDPVETRQNLFPLTYTRPVADCRVGIRTIREKWEYYINAPTYTLSETYLQAKYSAGDTKNGRTYINGSVIPTQELYAAIKNLNVEEKLLKGQALLAFKTDRTGISYENIQAKSEEAKAILYEAAYSRIDHPYDIFRINGGEIKNDFTEITKGRTSQKLSETNRVLGDLSQIFIEEGASVEFGIFNTTNGPIYIGKESEIMEGCIVRGPFALGDHAGLKMAAKIYGDTSIGPHCRVGGEVSNCIFFGYSNKGHDGFLGNSVIGEWCNLGADTNTSNLKNNYGTVDVWSYREEKYVSSGLQFHGLIMGDHSKSSINTMFNTGTVVGVAANIFDGGFPPKFVPSFTWGGANGSETFRFDKALEVAERMMERRNMKLQGVDIDILQEVFERDKKYRKK